MLLLHTEVAPAEVKLEKLREAFSAYSLAVAIHPRHTHALLGAGTALFELVSHCSDLESEETFERLCDKLQVGGALVHLCTLCAYAFFVVLQTCRSERLTI